MSLSAPKCRTCGVAEWWHTCGPKGFSRAVEAAQAISKPSISVTKATASVTIFATQPGSVTKFDEPVTKCTAPKRGRPKTHASAADRQRARRARLKAQSDAAGTPHVVLSVSNA